MSGVMIKMGVYGLLRVSLDLLGGGPAWWGGVTLGAGAISALLGVLFALMEHDLKRLLAYHSVENIGIILIGVGAGLIFHSYGLMPLAAVGFIGGLYHTLNHASFKGLLFLGAGSVSHATHTRNMEEMGGLIKRMPVTALCFLIGAIAISALPPLNGFASEWLVFQSLLGGFNIPKAEVAVMMPLAVGMLALTSGLAAACFVKAFGITFLAIPRSREAEHAMEAPLSMRAGMIILPYALHRRSGSQPGSGRARRAAGHSPRVHAQAFARHSGRRVSPLAGDARARRAHYSRIDSAGDACATRQSQTAPGRFVGLRAHRADAAHGVHRDLIRRATAAGVRGTLPPDEGTDHRFPSGVEILRPVHRIQK